MAVNMQFTKLQEKVEAHTKFMADSIPGQDTTGVGVGHNVGIRVDSEIHPVGAMWKVVCNGWVRSSWKRLLWCVSIER